ncbi:MAG TPA: TRAM domain-containing protein [Nitriliruptoraceae bacterium]|nr:TRAM domain-containing protein [Nitriliruptoraceae bacterium]
METVVDGFTHGGEGVARIDGKAVFVAGALPGERVRVRVTAERKRWARADLLDVLEPAPERVTPPCPYAAACGGCDLQHVSVAGQLHLKTRVVREQLERIGRLTEPPVRDCVPVGPALGYRTQARMHADADGHLGFHRHGTNDVVPVDRCIVLTPAAQSIRDVVGDNSGSVEATLHATSTGDRAAILTTDAPPVPVGADTMLGVRSPDHRAHTPPDWVQGSGVVGEHVAGFDFDVTAGGFFQGNIPGAEALVAAVLDAVATLAPDDAAQDAAAPAADDADPGASDDAPTDRTAPTERAPLVLDLYAGVGLFTLPLAATGARVTAVEVVADAVAHLADNAARAGQADRIVPVTADVAAFVDRSDLPDPDVVVVDPPRTGCGIEVMTALAATARSMIVYVACDPAALARDARVLVEAGWTLLQVRPFDLFPMTHHVEAVATFTRHD